MFVTALLLSLVSSFFVHIVYLSRYVINKEKRLLNRFLLTGVVNIFIMTILMIVAFREPQLFRKVNIGMLLWLLSGIITVILSIIKIKIFIRIYRRAKNPEYYHLNFFGRKVYNKRVIMKSEFIIVILQMPFFLFTGAYFIGKLVNIILHGFHF